MKNILFGAVLLFITVHVTAQTAPQPAKPEFKPVFEKAYLHTDRDVYAQGDTLWFKAYLVNAQNNIPINSSGNLYVELIAPDSAKIVSREIIRLNNGLGNGDFELDDSLAAGKYHLRAYTNWMRNFGDNFVFEKSITILNAKAVPVLNAQQTKNPALTDKGAPKAIAASAVSNAPLVRFYPEGGSMVTGISSIVAVKAEDAYGKGIPVNGAVISAAGDTVSHFICDTLGMGLFAMLPVQGQTYRAIVNKSAFNLPAALNKGLALHVRQTDTVLQVVISSTDNPAALTVKPHYTLEVKHGGQAYISQQLTATEQQTAVKVSTSSLPEGISAVTVYDEQNKPNCERLVYIHQPNTVKATVTTNKKTYRSKEPVVVNINARANTSLSVAVVDAGVVPEQADDIVSYLMLKSEVRGNIEHAGRYFDTTNVNRFKQLDLLLLTQGWRDFVWRRMADTAIRISYAAENGIIVSGKVRDENRNKLLPGLNISLFATGAKGNKIFTDVSDSLGRFNFQNLLIYGNQNIKLAAMNDKGQKKGALTVDTILPMPVNPQIVKIAAAEAAADSAAKAAVEQKSARIKASRINGITRLKEVKVSDRSARGKAIITNNGNVYTPWGNEQTLNITPKDYEYKTLSWYLIQKAKGALPANQGSGVVFIADGKRSAPIIFINGAQMFRGEDRTVYYNMPIEKFKSINIKEVVRNAPGMPVQFLLYLNLKDNYLVDNPGSLSVNIQGYYNARTFYDPVPGSRPTLADFRTTIHWDPNVKTDVNGHATLNFYNAVPLTDVRIVVQGLTNNGTPVAAITNYEMR